MENNFTDHIYEDPDVSPIEYHESKASFLDFFKKIRKNKKLFYAIATVCIVTTILAVISITVGVLVSKCKYNLGYRDLMYIHVLLLFLNHSYSGAFLTKF